MKYARIADNRVIETFTPPQGIDISECFTAELVAQFKQVPDEVEQNWMEQPDGTFTAPELPPLE